ADRGEGGEGGATLSRHAQLAAALHGEPGGEGNQAERQHDAEGADAQGDEIDEVAPRLLERLAHDARSGVPYDREGFVDVNGERAEHGVGAQGPGPPLVTGGLRA